MRGTVVAIHAVHLADGAAASVGLGLGGDEECLAAGGVVLDPRDVWRFSSVAA